MLRGPRTEDRPSYPVLVRDRTENQIQRQPIAPNSSTKKAANAQMSDQRSEYELWPHQSHRIRSINSQSWLVSCGHLVDSSAHYEGLINENDALYKFSYVLVFSHVQPISQCKVSTNVQKRRRRTTTTTAALWLTHSASAVSWASHDIHRLWALGHRRSEKKRPG